MYFRYIFIQPDALLCKRKPGSDFQLSGMAPATAGNRSQRCGALPLSGAPLGIFRRIVGLIARTLGRP
jgi:hypothetical protein